MSQYCPECEEVLTYEDYYGIGIPGTPEFKKVGDIFYCDNESCRMVDENGGSRVYFHTDADGQLHDGYPC